MLSDPGGACSLQNIFLGGHLPGGHSHLSLMHRDDSPMPHWQREEGTLAACPWRLRATIGPGRLPQKKQPWTIWGLVT